jgi:O-antigen ligase
MGGAAISFFLLGFFMMGGRSSQTNALYLFGVFIPWFFYRHRLKNSPVPFINIGLWLLALHFLFPIHNFLMGVIRHHSWQQIDIANFMEGAFSSAVGMSGLLMVIIGIFQKGRPAPDRQDTPLATAVEFFVTGMTAGSVVLLLFCIYQLFTGYDINPIAAFRADRQLANGLYRISGFSIHPIPFAGMCLALFSFSLVLGLTYPFEKARLKYQVRLISFIHLMLIVMTGSRVATIVAFAIFLGVLLRTRRLTLKQRVLLTAAVGGFFIVVSVASGLIYRFYESLGRGAASGWGERAVFWKVHAAMVKDHPWLGIGKYWLEHGIREEFYAQLGYIDFAHKYNAHNIYLELMSSVGLVGFALLCAAFYKLVCNFRSMIHHPETARLFWALSVAFGAELLFGLTQNTLADTPVTITLLTMLWVILWRVVQTQARRGAQRF